MRRVPPLDGSNRTALEASKRAVDPGPHLRIYVEAPRARPFELVSDALRTTTAREQSCERETTLTDGSSLRKRLNYRAARYIPCAEASQGHWKRRIGGRQVDRSVGRKRAR